MTWTELHYKDGQDWPALPDKFLARVAWKGEHGREEVSYLGVMQDEGRLYFDDGNVWSLEDITHWAPLTLPEGCTQ